jgi:fructose-1,6-bisphosphatase
VSQVAEFGQAASVISVYGPRTTLVIGLPGSTPRAVQLTLHGEAWEVTHSHLEIRPSGKVFAPG